MRISFSTIFQVAVLIVRDVLAFEAEQSGSNTNQPLPSAPATATDATTPVAPQSLDTQPVVTP